VITVSLTRVSNTHHTFSYTRPDGRGETLTLETKSFLFHDLLHYAVESEAGLRDSFFGKLARSESYDALTGPEVSYAGEIGMTEKIVGGLTGYMKAEQPPEVFLAGIRTWAEASGDEVPAWLTRAFVVNVKERMRKLQGAWKALPFGATMTLRFPPSS
jgi:hypothetical protein